MLGHADVRALLERILMRKPECLLEFRHGYGGPRRLTARVVIRLQRQAERCSYVCQGSHFGCEAWRFAGVLGADKTGMSHSGCGGKALIRSRSAGGWCPGGGRRIVRRPAGAAAD